MNRISNYIIVPVILIILSSNLKSQTYTGFTGGINFATLSGAHDFNKKLPRYGLSAGILFNITLKYEMTLEIGGLYSQQGATYKNEKFNFSSKEIYTVYKKIDYLMIPISWKQEWGDVYTKAGLYVELPLAAESSYKSIIEYGDSIKNLTDTSSTLIYSFTNSLRKYDVGACFGIGLINPISDQFDFFLDISYKFGFFPLLEYYRPDNMVKNSMFTVSVGLFLRGKDNRYATRKRR